MFSVPLVTLEALGPPGDEDKKNDPWPLIPGDKPFPGTGTQQPGHPKARPRAKRQGCHLLCQTQGGLWWVPEDLPLSPAIQWEVTPSCKGRGVLHNRDLKNQPSWPRQVSEVTGVTQAGPDLCDRPEPGPTPATSLPSMYALAPSLSREPPSTANPASSPVHVPLFTGRLLPPTKPSRPSFPLEAASRSPLDMQGALTVHPLPNSGTGSQWGSCGLYPRMLCWCPQPV